MTNNIVTISVSQTVAPTPDKLQKTGAFLSMGATVENQGNSTLITEMADLTDILRTAGNLTTVAWAGGNVTATAAAAHGFTANITVPMTIAGVTPTAYNGNYDAIITGNTTFTYPLVSNPGNQTVAGTYIPQSVGEVTAMGDTFFAQGASQGVYVLELGPGNASVTESYFETWLSGNLSQYYSFLAPRSWGNLSAFGNLTAQYESTTSKVYFFTTMLAANYTRFLGIKSVVGMIEYTTIPATEFSLASAFWVSLHYDPSPTNKVSPFAFSYLFGVTPYPTAGNGALLNTYKAAYVNVVGTGAEGGISNKILKWGANMDGRQFNYWYSVDWVQINCDLNISNAVINGSNNPTNPLYYNQNGINRLQAVVAATMASGISFGLVVGDIVQTALSGAEFQQALDDGLYSGKTVVNAVPFLSYSAANPGDYSQGVYGGLSVAYTPQLGFTSIVFNIQVSDFVAQ